MAQNVVDYATDKEVERRKKLRDAGTPMADEGLSGAKKPKEKGMGDRFLEAGEKFVSKVESLNPFRKKKKAEDQAKALENGY